MNRLFFVALWLVANRVRILVALLAAMLLLAVGVYVAGGRLVAP